MQLYTLQLRCTKLQLSRKDLSPLTSPATLELPGKLDRTFLESYIAKQVYCTSAVADRHLRRG
jgi:hypothetical protein